MFVSLNQVKGRNIIKTISTVMGWPSKERE